MYSSCGILHHDQTERINNAFMLLCVVLQNAPMYAECYAECGVPQDDEKDNLAVCKLLGGAEAC